MFQFCSEFPHGHVFPFTKLLPLFGVQPLSRVRLFATPWTAARSASLSFSVPWSSLRFTSMRKICLFMFSRAGPLFRMREQGLPFAVGTGFSLWRLLLLRNSGSRCLGFTSGSGAPEHRPSGCGTWTQLLCDMWDLPGPGIEPMSCALQGVLLTTEPPRTSSRIFKKLLSLHLILFANM